MRQVRVYHPQPLAINAIVELSDDAFGHVSRVLRMGQGDPITLFCGDGHDYHGEICQVSKKSMSVQLNQQQPLANESPLRIHLGQGISRGDKMDFTIQKAVELGVTEITPLFTERCGVKLNGERMDKKQQQWQKIAIAACEQSGRAVVPTVHEPISLQQWLAQPSAELKLNLHPKAAHSLKTIPTPSHGVRFVIGPEGGLNDAEIEQTTQAGFIDIQLGPRVLRTETAALTVLSALQVQFGDLA